MSSLKTLSTVLFLAAPGLTCTLAPTHAMPDTPDEQLRLFAVCAGRYSALMEHQWLIDDPRSNQSEAMRTQFVDLVDALLPVARKNGLPTAQPLGWRISAKASLQVLLQRASFGDERSAAHAARLVRRDLGQCSQMLLS